MTLGFYSNELKLIKNTIITEEFTNGIFFGRTGSGKTSCGILPNIEKRIKLNHGLLVYDFKGNLHAQVKYLANKYDKLSNVIEIGKPWANKINLCDYLNIGNLSQIVPSSNELDSYWNNASRNLLETIFKIHKDFNHLITELEYCWANTENHLVFRESEFIKKCTYNQIYKYINSIKSIKEFYTTALNMHSELNFILIWNVKKDENYSLYLAYNKILDNISELTRSLEYYNHAKLEDNSGKNAVLNHLSSILIDVAKKDFLNESQIDIVKELRAGKIIIVDVSTFNEDTLNIFNLAIYTRLQKSYFTNIKPVTIFIDEAQKVLNANYLPQVDVCRESLFEYIFATQDEILLENKLGKNKFAELYANIISKYSFATNNNDIRNNFEYIDLNTNRKAFADPLFLDKDDLFLVEYQFQKKNEIFLYSDYIPNKNEKYVLKYDEKLIEEYKVLIQKSNNKYLEAKFLLFPDKNRILGNSDKTKNLVDLDEIIDINCISNNEDDEKIFYFEDNELNEIEDEYEFYNRDDLDSTDDIESIEDLLIQIDEEDEESLDENWTDPNFGFFPDIHMNIKDNKKSDFK